MSLETYAALGMALGTAAEATGATAFTPIGKQARESGNSGPTVPSVPDSGPGLGEIMAAVQAAQQGQQGGGGVNVDLGSFTGGQQGGGQQSAASIAQAVSDAYEQGAQTVKETTEKAEETAKETTEKATGGGGSNPFDRGLYDAAKDAPSVLDKTERAGGQIKEAGGTVKDATTDSVGGLAKVGNTGTQVVKALSGQEYSTGDTLAESVHGDTTRKIDWDKYNPLSGSGGSSGSSGSSESESDAELDLSAAKQFTGGLLP